MSRIDTRYTSFPGTGLGDKHPTARNRQKQCTKQEEEEEKTKNKEARQVFENVSLVSSTVLEPRERYPSHKNKKRLNCHCMRWKGIIEGKVDSFLCLLQSPLTQ